MASALLAIIVFPVGGVARAFGNSLATSLPEYELGTRTDEHSRCSQFEGVCNPADGAAECKQGQGGPSGKSCARSTASCITTGRDFIQERVQPLGSDMRRFRSGWVTTA